MRSRDGRWLYVANWGSSDLGAYRITDDGALASPVRIAAAAPTPVTPSALALTPDGHNLYMANFSNGTEGTVSHFAVDADGIPRGVTTISAHGAGTTSLTVSPDGRTLLTANMSSGDVSSFAIGTAGEPSWVATVATGGGAFVPAITPAGDQALVTNSTADSVALLSLGRDSQIAVVATVPNPAREPRGVVIEAAGGHAYVANFAGGTGPGAITTFAIRAGELVPIGDARPTGSNGAEGIALAADGETLYVANFNTDGDGSVTGFPVVPDGSLGEPRPPLPTGGRRPDLSSITVPDP